MSTTHIVVPAHALHPAVTHGPTRHALSTAGLPARHDLIRFRPLAESRVVPVPELLSEGADPERLDPHIAELLLIGHLRCEGDDAQEVVLDGATGRVFTMDLFEDAPALIDVVPLAPSLGSLCRFLACADDFRCLAGRFATLAGRTGPDVVAEASSLLASVFTGEDWGDDGWGSAGPPSTWDHALPAFWRIVAHIRPLALVAGPGSGLLLDLPPDLLDAEFGAQEMVRTEPAGLPRALAHEPTRRFLTGTGLPKAESMFALWRDSSLFRTLAESGAGETGPEWRTGVPGPGSGTGAPGSAGDGIDERLPPDAKHLVCLGGLIHDLEVLIDGRTGLVSHRFYGEDTTTPLNADISTLAFTLWMYSQEQRLNDEHDFTRDFHDQLADAMTEALASVDPVACLPSTGEDDHRYWPEVFHDEAGGVL
ncbi:MULTISPECIES: SUKH-4 family immunity protein [Streptomyces]|uniref:SUKH-4 family immunity protein n=1 Tax=Streptomyces TaxID=1883 RepID=UPI0004BD1F14|nr:SUKH-4 family immunity protein [Streptomyces griseolus]